MESAFGIDHGDISKLDQRQKRNAVIGGVAGTGAAGAAAAQIRVPEHSHFDNKTRKYIRSLEPGVHEVDTKMLAKKPRKLGARKQQTPYVAAMSRERPLPYSPVPITRYKGDKGVIQRDNAHSVMANAMTGRKTLIQVEDHPGHRPNRRLGEELTRRTQAKYQEHRLARNFNIGEKKISQHINNYKPKSRAANTAKRPHGVVEEKIKGSPVKYGAKVALGIKKSHRNDEAAGVLAGTGVGVLGSTPVRRSAAVVDINDNQIRANDAKKILNPGYRPGNKKAIKGMAHELPPKAQGPTTVIRYKGGHVIPWDGNHRGTARVARGDSHIPVKVIQGGERPDVGVARNVYHATRQKIHQNRMDRGVFTPKKVKREGKLYGKIANASPTRSGRKIATYMAESTGPTKGMLRAKQGAFLAGGAGLLAAAEHEHRKGKQ